MKKLHFSIQIDAPRQKVWEMITTQETFREWTKVFNNQSRFEGSWEKGMPIRFIGTDEHGNLGGTIAEIVENKEHELITIKHLGIIKNGREDLDSEESKNWQGATETYMFKDIEGGTELTIEALMNDSFVQFFSEMWPKALQILKELAEK